MTSPRLEAAAASTRTEAEARRAMTQYEIHFSKVRAAKGLKPYAVMAIVDEGFSRGVSQHDTREEAEAAKANLESGEK